MGTMVARQGSAGTTTHGSRPIRVLAADDSAVMRGIFRSLLWREGSANGDLRAIELCGVAQDGVECLEAVARLRPDVVVLDLEMPRMHGLEVLKRLRQEEPGLPAIMCSSYTELGARSTLDALALGAADYVMKPSQQHDFAAAMAVLSAQLLPKIVALAGYRDAGRQTSRPAAARRTEAVTRNPNGGPAHAVEIVVIGVSTGGPPALEQILPRLPSDFPVPILIVQHMPKLFTAALADRLNRRCALQVSEASEGAEPRAGTIWLAPGDAHMEVRGTRHSPAIHLHEGQALNHCKPSVDYLFQSAARLYGAATLALVMTGMGSDGLNGARCVHQAGGAVLAQDEASSAVWGMPGRVTQAGLVRHAMPLHVLPDELIRRVAAGRKARRTAAEADPIAAGR